MTESPPRTNRPAAATAPGEQPEPAAEQATHDEVATYEQAKDELADVVGRLESGGLSLDDSLRLWERGEYLAAVCNRFLDGARARVESALARADDTD